MQFTFLLRYWMFEFQCSELIDLYVISRSIINIQFTHWNNEENTQKHTLPLRNIRNYCKNITRNYTLTKETEKNTVSNRFVTLSTVAVCEMLHFKFEATRPDQNTLIEIHGPYQPKIGPRHWYPLNVLHTVFGTVRIIKCVVVKSEHPKQSCTFVCVWCGHSKI